MGPDDVDHVDGHLLDLASLDLLEEAAKRLDRGFSHLPSNGADRVDREEMRSVLLATADRLTDNFPYPHPLYAGQMLKPPHPVARLAYCLAMWINPNNHALDGGRASSKMEKEAVAEIAAMVGWTSFLGHLCGGGTMANLEALWVAGRSRPGGAVVASAQAHYTHRRLAEVLGLPFHPVACDRAARMDLAELDAVLASQNVGTVVATVGSTASGSVDQLPPILERQRRYGFRLHVDAAYGGYYVLATNLRPDTRAAFDCLGAADSIAIDPHKHGLQPYGCGCVLFRDPAVRAFYAHDSPYTYFTSDELHLGEISLECSRPGASAVALWATQRLLPLVPGGRFAHGLEDCREAATELAARIEADRRWRLAFEPELDIVVWAPRAPTASQTSAFSRAILAGAADAGLHLAVADFPAAVLRHRWPDLGWDQDSVTCLRSCLLKPDHRAWVDRILEILNRVADLR